MATCRFGGTNNCDGNASNYDMGDIVFGSGGNLYECVNVAGCSQTVAPTVASTDWTALVGGDPLTNSSTSRMEINATTVKIFEGSTLRVILGDLT